MRLSKYEKETIILTSEGDDTVQIYTFNASLKRRLAEYAEKYPHLARLDRWTAEGIDTVLRKLLAKREYPLDSFEIKEAVAEYGFIMKMLYQIKDEKPVMLSVAESYRDTRVREKIDADYGEGASDFFANAIKQFYQ